MSLLLLLVAGVLLWLGIDALLLARHGSSPTQVEKDEMMLGPEHRRPVADFLRQFAERHYPFAGGSSMTFYGLLFIVAAVIVAWLAWEQRV